MSQQCNAHTPGPLAYGTMGGCYLVWTAGERDEEVARCSGPRAEANARIIAAAPELLAALVAIEEIASDLAEFNESDAAAYTGREIATAARNAIARATGTEAQ